jgi:hypothetical protein
MADGPSTAEAVVATGAAGTQSSPSHLAQLLHNCDRLLEADRPVLVSVLAPRGRADRLLVRARQAVESRAFPLWFAPGDGTLDLSANPSPDQPYSDDRRWTPARWAAEDPVHGSSFKRLRPHGLPTGAKPHAEIVENEDRGPGYVHLDADHVALVPDELHKRSVALLERWGRMRGRPAPTLPDVPTAAEPAAAPQPVIPVDALQTLTHRLMRLSGFAPDSDRGQETLRDYLDAVRNEVRVEAAKTE